MNFRTGLKTSFFFLPALLILGAMIAERAYNLRHSTQTVFEITGYDPRHILAGHYLRYTVQYGLPQNRFGREEPCAEKPRTAKKVPAFICLDDHTVTFQTPPEACQTFVKGTCHYSRFQAGIERFYIPEEKAEELDQKLRDKGAKIRVSLAKDGTAMVTDLFFAEEDTTPDAAAQN